MSSFSLDIQGQLNSIKLADSKSLWPLFEAVVNAIQSIEDSPNRDSGNISIVAYREEQPLTLDGIEQLGKFESFEVVDNGTGFNAENYKSFNTAYSTFKITKGCKGIGRFLWLKAFNSVNICSVFHEDGAIYKREFDFNPVDGVTPENNVINIDSGEPKTAIFLKGFSHLYRQKCPVELDVIAKKVIEHCLLFFISDNCPQITISDNVSATIDLNQYFNATIKDSLNQDKFELSKEEFVLYHLRLPEGSTKHELHLCANMQEVASIELKHYMPDLQKKIVPTDFPTGFYYVGYLTSPYLNSIVNTTRTEFNYDEKFDQVSLQGTGKDSLISSSIGFIAAYLADYIIDIKDNPLSQMGKYIDEIVSGSKRRANGLSFGASSSTSFRCFAICDMSPKMEAHCKDACLRLMPDGMGYYGYRPERNAYFEVISYPKLLADAKKRNRILFEKLFDPNPNEIIHFPNT